MSTRMTRLLATLVPVIALVATLGYKWPAHW